jgi:putative phosphoribosyl transferase
LLSSLLAIYSKRDDVIVVAIPRGGVPVAVEVAQTLRLPLSLQVVEKICIPVHEAWQSIQSIGAVAENGVLVLDTRRIKALEIPSGEVEQATMLARNDQAHKAELYRHVYSPLDIRNKTVLLIDDAVNSGATMQAAIQVLRQEMPAKILIAAPVGSTGAIRDLSTLADRVVCPVQAAEGTAVSECYAHFPRITDAVAYAMMESRLTHPTRARSTA